VLQFLKAQIGYRKGDSAWQLAQSDAGLRFLGLAACLQTMGSWNAAVALHSMIYDSASDKKLVPTTQHLKHLMEALNSKLAASGFADHALGWTLILENLRDHGDAEPQSMTPGQRTGTMQPPAQAVVKLVQAMARLARLGEEVKKIEVLTPLENGAWLAAFVKWCLGAPPDIIFNDAQTLTSEHPSQVILRLSPNTKKIQSVRVILYDYAGNLMELVKTEASNSEFAGLVSTRIFGQTALRRFFGHENDPRHRACIQALPYACGMVRKKLQIRREWSTSKISTASLAGWLDVGITATKGQVFPSEENIAQVLHEYLSCNDDEAPRLLEESQDGVIIEDLSLVNMVKSRLLQGCTCRSCQNKAMKIDPNCKYQTFISSVSTCVAHILALSLVNSADQAGMKLRFPSFLEGHGGPFIKSIQSTILGSTSTCSVSDILQTVVSLLGHDIKHNPHGWVMSSYYGQTVYPQLFATQTLRSENILALECISGVLMLGDECYSNVMVERWIGQDDSSDESDTDLPANQVQNRQARLANGKRIHPENSFPSHKLRWRLLHKENNLEISLSVPQFPALPVENPRFALESMAESIFVNCTHEQMTDFTITTNNVYITQPLAPVPRSQDINSIGIVQCDENEQMRFFTLAKGHPGVIRQNACLECCMKCCQLVAARFILC